MRPVITSTPPMSPRHPSGSLLLALLALLAAMLSYQCGAALAKHLFPLVGAQGATAYRLGLGALIMLAIRRPWRKRRPSANPRVLWAYGLSMGAMNLVFYLALRTIPLGIAVAIEFCGPLVIAMLGMRRWADFVWIALAIGGLLLLLPFHGQLHALDPMGVFYAALAGVGWALYILFGQRAGAAYGDDAVTLGIAIGALLVVPVGFAHAGTALLGWQLLPAAVGLAILSSALPYTLEMISLTRLPARTFSVLLSLEPAVAALSGLVFLREQLTPLQWLAIAAVIVAAAGASYHSRQPEPEHLA